MSHIENLMKELNLSQSTIDSTLDKVSEICINSYENSNHFYLRLNGNGDGDGDN